MCYKIFLLLLFCCANSFLYAQRGSSQEKKDRKVLDSLCRKHPDLCAAYGTLMGSHSVFNGLEKTSLKPKEQYCFDKKITYSGLINNKPVDGCYYISTQNGLVAKREDRDNSCRPLMDFDKGYRLSIYSMRGEAYSYTIDAKKNRLFLATPVLQDGPGTGTGTTFEIHNRYLLENDIAEKRSDHNYPTHMYHIRETTQPALYYLFVPYRAGEISVQDYLGMYGTGYYKDRYGNAILCLTMDSDPQNYIRIDKIMEVNDCFDGSSFESMAEESSNAETESSDRKKRDLQNRMNEDAAYACNAREQLIELERLMQEKSDRASELAKSGNINSPAAMRTLMEGNDVLDQVEKHKLKLQVKICSLNHSIQSGNISPELKAKYLAEISCLNRSVSQLTNLKNEIAIVANTYARNPGKAVTEKNRLYINGINDIDLGCNADRNGNIKPKPGVKNPVRIRNNR